MKKNNNDRGIMIVDDDSDNFIIFGEILRANGFENDFVYCSDGGTRKIHRCPSLSCWI